MGLVSVNWAWQSPGSSLSRASKIGVGAILMQVGYGMFRQSLSFRGDGGGIRKNIVVCIDGTWNLPGQTDFGQLAETNVLKLYKMLKGETTTGRQHNASETRRYRDLKGITRQIAFYFQGVGNKVENSTLGQLFGGAFGMGADAIVERAYLDVVREYRQGDRIFLFGFSRGAAIARLLANAIDRRGIPESLWTLSLFGRHWLIRASSQKFLRVEVNVLGCWDTVGAFGISKTILGFPFQKINLLKDLNVALCVKRAYHMVAIDETRNSFEPTLMEPDPTCPARIVEVWFTGNHANVGGGFATSKLSDVTLDFLLRHISSGYAPDDKGEPENESWGLYLRAVRRSDVKEGGTDPTVLVPDHRGQLRYSTGVMYDHRPRKLPLHAVIFDSVFARMQDTVPVYALQSLFNLNEDLICKQADIEKQVAILLKTASLTTEESETITKLIETNLSLTRWSRDPLSNALRPCEELSNLPT